MNISIKGELHIKRNCIHGSKMKVFETHFFVLLSNGTTAWKKPFEPESNIFIEKHQSVSNSLAFHAEAVDGIILDFNAKM